MSALFCTLLLAHEAASVALLYAVFCRCTRADHATPALRRLALLLLGTVACLGIVAPLLWAEAL